MFDRDHLEEIDQGGRETRATTSLASISSFNPFRPIWAKELPCRLPIMSYYVHGLGRLQRSGRYLRSVDHRANSGTDHRFTPNLQPAASQ